MEILNYVNKTMKELEILESTITNLEDLQILVSNIIDTMCNLDPRLKNSLKNCRSTIYDTLAYSIEEDGFIYYKDILDLIKNSLNNYAIEQKRKMNNGTS